MRTSRLCSSRSRSGPKRSWPIRAKARLALGRLEGAEADAAGAYRRKPSPSRERLWVRTLLALHRVEDLLWLNRPDDLTILPGGGPSLLADLREADKRLQSLAEENRADRGRWARSSGPARCS